MSKKQSSVLRMSHVRLPEQPHLWRRDPQVLLQMARRGAFPDGKKFRTEPVGEIPSPFWNLMPDNSWKGRRCFIIGGGASLKGFDWSLLRGELTIAINRAFQFYPDCSVMFTMDTRVWPWIELGHIVKDKVEAKEIRRLYHNLKGFRVLLRTAVVPMPPETYNIFCIGANGWGKSIETGLAGGSNSGYGALNLAYVLGANPIYLLGFDMHGDGDGHQAHFHTGYHDQQGNRVLQTDQVYEKFKAYFNEIAPRLKEEGVRVVNLNPNSAMKCFGFGQIEDVKSIRRPLIISYFTKETGYEKEVQRLILSLKRFGMRYDIQGIENRGDWQANTYYKAEFIREMLDKHPDEDVVWLDADSELVDYPKLFEDFKADVGFHVFDWSKYRTRIKVEASSAVVYVKNNAAGRRFVDAWVQTNKQYRSSVVWEQKNLHRVWVDSQIMKGIRLQEFPDTYCKIFDLMAKVENPVIVQYQASRRYRHAVGAVS